MSNPNPTFRFEIDNFSTKEARISSKKFVSGGCNWYIRLYPKGDTDDEDQYSSLYLHAANTKLLGTGWKRSATFYFIILDQSNKELYKSSVTPGRTLFCAVSPSWGYRKTLSRSILLEDDRLIVEVYIEDVEAFDGEGIYESDNKTTIINGFQVFASQATSVSKIFEDHPDIAEDVKPKNGAVKTAYMNIILNLINDLEKPPNSLTLTKLSKARREISELKNVGFKLDWLKLKLEDVSLEKKKLDESRIQKLEGFVKDLKLTSSFELESLKSKLDEVSSEVKKSYDAEESRAKEVEERIKNVVTMVESLEDAEESWAEELEELIKNLEVMELKLESLVSLKAKLDEFTSERKKSDDVDESRAKELEERVKSLERNVALMRKESEHAARELDERVKNLEVMELGTKLDSLKKADEAKAKQVEERVKNLEMMELGTKLDSLNAKLDEVSLEMEMSDDFGTCRSKILEKRVKNLEMMEVGMKSRVQELEESNKEMKLMEVEMKSRVQQLEESNEEMKVILSSLKIQLDNKKNKSFSDDGFLLVD